MSASVTLTKRGGTFQIILSKELWDRNLKERWHCNLKGTLNQNVKGICKSKFQKELYNRNLKGTSNSSFKSHFKTEMQKWTLKSKCERDFIIWYLKEI